MEPKGEDGRASSRPGDYEAIASTGTRGGSASRGRAVAIAAVGTLAVVCIAAIGGGQENGRNPLALGIEKLMLGGHSESLLIGQAERKVKYFTLNQDPSLGSQASSWGYEGEEKGPAAWSTVAPEFAVCASGQMQSPVNIERTEEKARLNLPPLRWQGYEQEPFVEEGRESRAFFDGHSISLSGPSATAGMGGPRIAVHGFSRYLPDLPLDKVAMVNYTFKEVRFHTPAEHQIDGEIFPFEMQMVHECNALTDPPCPINKTMIVSALFTEAKVGWGETSPSFLSSVLDDMKLIEGVWSQYVESFAFDFGQVGLLCIPLPPSPSLLFLPPVSLHAPKNAPFNFDN